MIVRWFQVLILLVFVSVSPAYSTQVAVLLDVKGAIGPASSDYIEQGLKKAQERKADLVILRIDTPGGLDTSMRGIIQNILKSPIPVVTYVAPSGARAASAGTYILYASHIAAMAPGTNLGAATPIQLGEGSPLPLPTGEKGKQTEKSKHPTLSDKAVSDAVAYAKGLAEYHGRNAVWIERAVKEAASASAQEALRENVIEVVADDPQHLLKQLHGRQVRVQNKVKTLDTSNMVIVEVEPDWRNELLALVTNPNIAYILLIVGVYGLIFEFMNPGAIAPGVFGAIFLLLGLYALHLLPINYAGLALMLLGIAFMVAEAFAPSFGILGFGGIIAFVIGSVMLLDTDVPGFGVSWPLIGGFAASCAFFSVFVLGLAIKARQRPIVTGAQEMVGACGEVLTWEKNKGTVRVHGESWAAVSPEGLKKGALICVIECKGLTLTVMPREDKGD